MAEVKALRSRRPCPECKKMSVRDFYPFCSQRCQDKDLSRWLNGAYAIPLVEDEEVPDANTGSDS